MAAESNDLEGQINSDVEDHYKTTFRITCKYQPFNISFDKNIYVISCQHKGAGFSTDANIEDETSTSDGVESVQ